MSVDINGDLNRILHGRYGEDVRQAIHDAVSGLNDNVQEAVDAAETRIPDIEDSLDAIEQKLTQFEGGSGIYVGTCSTSSDTALKEIIVPGFPSEYKNGQMILVYFANAVYPTDEGDPICQIQVRIDERTVLASKALYFYGETSEYWMTAYQKHLIAQGTAVLLCYMSDQWHVAAPAFSPYSDTAEHAYRTN